MWAHQAAEKAMKALLTQLDIDPPRWHDLDRLVQRLPETERPAFEALDLPELTRWAVEGRYPADLEDASAADAAEAIDTAKSVLDLVTAKVATPAETTSDDDTESE